MSRKECAALAQLGTDHWRRIEKGMTGNSRETVRNASRAVGADAEEAFRRYGLPQEVEPR